MAAGHGAADVSSTRAASAPGLKATPAGSCLGLCRPAPAVLRAAVVIALLARSAPAFAADPPGIGWFAQLGLISSAVDDRAALREGIGFRGFGDNADGGLTALALAAGVGIQFDSVADLQPYTVWRVVSFRGPEDAGHPRRRGLVGARRREQGPPRGRRRTRGHLARGDRVRGLPVGETGISRRRLFRVLPRVPARERRSVPDCLPHVRGRERPPQQRHRWRRLVVPVVRHASRAREAVRQAASGGEVRRHGGSPDCDGGRHGRRGLVMRHTGHLAKVPGLDLVEH